MTVVVVYVDDLIVMSTSIERLDNVKKAHSERFKMKDMGPLPWSQSMVGSLLYCADCDDRHSTSDSLFWEEVQSVGAAESNQLLLYLQQSRSTVQQHRKQLGFKYSSQIFVCHLSQSL